MAEVKEMSVYEALAEIKLLDKEIKKMISSPIDFFASVPESNEKVSAEKKEEAKKKVKAWYDKYLAKVNRLTLLQGLVYESNNNTKITVDGKEYPSVTMALQRYTHIDQEENLYSTIVANLVATKNEVESKNEKISDEEIIMRKITPPGVQLAAEDITRLKESYIANNKLILFDPLEMDKDDKARTLLAEVIAFKEKFHMELNKVNLMTIIKVPVVEPQL